MIRFAFLVLLLTGSAAAQSLDVTIGYLEARVTRPPTLSNLEEVPKDEGLAGARLGTADNATTGRFLGQTHKLEERVVPVGGDVTVAARELLVLTPFVVVNAPRNTLLKIADLPEAKGAILLNTAAPDNDLRSDACRANVLHTLPSRAMLADALAQFAVKRRWTDWVLIEGERPGDAAFAEALRRSATKFRVSIEGEKIWRFDADMRRSAAAEVPLFTQDLPDHDLIVVADETEDWARYILYHTWLPRPVAGSEGLVPSAWSAAVEQHGAAQLQSRFEELANRKMRSIDYAAWAGVRAVGEAVTRMKSTEAATVRDNLLGDAFEMAGFKGRPLTFRAWNGQLRQPIPLSHPRAVVALAPLEGFLHRTNELDTLGLDEPESKCGTF